MTIPSYQLLASNKHSSLSIHKNYHVLMVQSTNDGAINWWCNQNVNPNIKKNPARKKIVTITTGYIRQHSQFRIQTY